MGSNLIIVVFAVVVIGGMGSILGSILTGLGLGVVEGLTKVFYPEASNTVVFVVMALVLRGASRRPVRQRENEQERHLPLGCGSPCSSPSRCVRPSSGCIRCSR